MKYLLVLTFLGLNANAASLDKEVKAAITKAAKAHNVPEWELLKIAYVESTLRKNPPMRHNKNNTYDIGMFQINSIHWFTICKKYDVTQLDGNAMCAAKLLAQHLKHSKTDANWPARYHSKTPKYKQIYANKLSQAETQLAQRNIASSWEP